MEPCPLCETVHQTEILGCRAYQTEGKYCYKGRLLSELKMLGYSHLELKGHSSNQLK